MGVKRIYKNKIFKSILDTMKEQAVVGNASAAVENKTNASFYVIGNSQACFESAKRNSQSSAA